MGEFERLGREPWTQSFRMRVGLLASKLNVELYGKEPKKVRSSTKPACPAPRDFDSRSMAER